MKNDYRKKSGGWKGAKKNSYKSAFKDGGGRDRGGYGGGSNSGSRPNMHSATCAKCRERCEVPFKPNGKKPIFCSNCFEREVQAPERSGGQDKPAYRSTPRGGGEEVGKQLRQLNKTMSEILSVLTGFGEELIAGDEDDDEEGDFKI